MDRTNETPPRKVVLFSGHMVDGPDREKPRFPPDKEPIAAHAIAAALDKLAIEAPDLCICGGDLLFAEGALSHSARLELYIPFDESAFLKKSVDFAGSSWRDRFFAVKTRAALHVQPIELGPPLANEDPYERNNPWMLGRLHASARRGSTFSASGMERAATARVARAT
jgi:hypothetical protein